MNSETWFSIRLSLQVALISTLLVIIFGSLISYLLARKNFLGKNFLEVFITLPLILPPTVTGYYLIFIFGRSGIIGKFIYNLTGFSIMFTWQAAVVASFVVSLPLMIKATQAAIESVDKNMIDSAYMLGYGEIETAIKIIFPLAKKGFLVGIILSFARALGEFGATLMLAGNIPSKTNTMPLEIYSSLSSGDWSKAHGLVIIMTLISVVFLYVANKFQKRIF